MLTPLRSAIDAAGSSHRCGNAPGGPVSREPPADQDDLGWDVPDEDNDSGRDDENWDPDDDSDLELEDEDEDVGLDTDTGFEEGEDLELDDAGEDERWTVDSEAADELPGADADVISGEEYGYIGDDEPAEADDDLDAEMEDEALPNLDDGGAEGVDDEADLEDFELGGMPDLDSSAEEEAEGFVAENIEELAGVSLIDDPTLELVPGHPWKLLPAGAARVTLVATLPSPVLAFTAVGKHVALAAGDGWFQSLAQSGLTRLPIEAAPGRSVALVEHEGRVVYALASPAGLFLSHDSARSFELQREADPPVQVGLTTSGGRLKIWARNQRGLLSVSDDGGRSFNAARLDGVVQTFATDGERRLCALVRRTNRLAFGLSSDSGRRWSWVDAEATASDPAPQLLPGRGLAVVAAHDRLSHIQASQQPRLVSPLLQGPAALLDEDDETFVYACTPQEDQTLIVRTALRRGAQPMVVTSLARERVGEPRFLEAVYAEGGFVMLHVATDQALLRIELSLDGDDLP